MFYFNLQWSYYQWGSFVQRSTTYCHCVSAQLIEHPSKVPDWCNSTDWLWFKTLPSVGSRTKILAAHLANAHGYSVVSAWFRNVAKSTTCKWGSQAGQVVHMKNLSRPQGRSGSRSTRRSWRRSWSCRPTSRWSRSTSLKRTRSSRSSGSWTGWSTSTPTFVWSLPNNH